MTGDFKLLVYILVGATISVASEEEAKSAQCFKFAVKDDESLTKVDIEHDENSVIEVSDTAMTSCTGRRLLSVSIHKNGVSASQIARRADYEFFPGLGYYKLHTLGRHWSAAEATCRSEGSHLLIVNTPQENNVTETFFNRNPSFTGAVWSTWLWIGVHKVNGIFTTVLGDTFPSIGYSNWRPGEPTGNGDCVAINTKSLLDDDGCQYAAAFVCEMPS